MGLFNALTTAVGGLQAQSFALQNISGNIANSQTTGFKETDTAFDALVSVAAVFTLDGGNWKDGRITLGGVSPVPYRATVVENALKGKDIKATVKAAAAQLRTVARPMSLNAYKIDLAQGLIERTILEALG